MAVLAGLLVAGVGLGAVVAAVKFRPLSRVFTFDVIATVVVLTTSAVAWPLTNEQTDREIAIDILSGAPLWVAWAVVPLAIVAAGIAICRVVGVRRLERWVAGGLSAVLMLYLWLFTYSLVWELWGICLLPGGATEDVARGYGYDCNPRP